uniref:Uncharacterized protein n=1 Tax=Heterorhabditis bacteriophora TaxID=37862 RepID=A0A1I7W8N9_HETBA
MLLFVHVCWFYTYFRIFRLTFIVINSVLFYCYYLVLSPILKNFSRFRYFKMVSAIKPWLFDPISLLKRDMRNNISLRLSGLADADISYQSQAVVEKARLCVFNTI